MRVALCASRPEWEDRPCSSEISPLLGGGLLRELDSVSLLRSNPYNHEMARGITVLVADILCSTRTFPRLVNPPQQTANSKQQTANSPYTYCCKYQKLKSQQYCTPEAVSSTMLKRCGRICRIFWRYVYVNCQYQYQYAYAYAYAYGMHTKRSKSKEGAFHRAPKLPRICRQERSRAHTRALPAPPFPKHA